MMARLIDDEPLFDMDDRLLGYSRRAFATEVEVTGATLYSENPKDRILEIHRQIGLDITTAKGVECAHSKKDRGFYLFWFQPLFIHASWCPATFYDDLDCFCQTKERYDTRSDVQNS